jgi:DNA processing protein
MSILSETKPMKINSYLPDEHIFLQRLGSLAHIPKKLYLRGLLPKTGKYSVAIVGTRKPTMYGTQVACEIAEKLAQQGVIIVSGLAYGIDTAAHTGALQGHGTTIAVMAHGLDSIYPRGNSRLAETILEKGGALISEYKPGTEAMKHRFLERNRIVSGLADAILVVEAGERSGTLRTVAEALEQGKEVFAVPGPITSEQSVGPNRLIQKGAHPVLSADDIMAVLDPQWRPAQQTILATANPEEKKLLELLQKGIQAGDQLIEQSGLSASQFAQTIIMLELQGLIRPLGANQWTRIR